MMQRRFFTPPLTLAAALTVSFVTLPVLAAPPEQGLLSESTTATDALGRKLPTASETHPYRADRFVGIFYFIWQGGHGKPGPYDISKILKANPDKPAWGPSPAFHWWGEPEAGYFDAGDPWLIRRNLTLLQDAGVDVLLLDVTNAFTYPEVVKALCETARTMRAEGNQTPQIAFVTHAHMPATVTRLWNEVYSKNAYPELWFRWQGKPLLLGKRDAVDKDGARIPEEVQNFFTWRDSWAWQPGQGRWPWIEKYPQQGGYDQNPTPLEEMPVAVASHPTSNIGRSFHNNAQPTVDKYGMTTTANLGLHFAEQWIRALEADPQFLFITGWNEWVAQRFVASDKSHPGFLGKPTKAGNTFFVDAYNSEFNRDIDPARGAEGDTLYYQMVAGIRRYKGVRPVSKVSQTKTIKIDGDVAQWEGVLPDYRDSVGDTAHRDFVGWGDSHYKDTTGRNDFVRAKVTCDKTNVYFYVETKAAITPRTDTNWMMLLLDTDQKTETGWHGYDFAVNISRPKSATTAILSRSVAGGEWQSVGEISYHLVGNKMAIKIPRSVLGLMPGPVRLDFHWADNVSLSGIEAKATPFGLHGDSAPNRRANYRYESP